MLIVCNPTVDLTIRLAISHLAVFPKVALRFPVLSSCSFWRCCFLRYRGRPPPRSFTPFLPLCFGWCFLSNVHRFEVSRPAIFARRVAPLRAATNFSRGPNFTLVRSCAKMSFLSRATAPWRDTFLSARVTQFWDPQYPRVLLRLLAALRGQIPVPTPLLRFSNRHYCGFFGDLLMLPYRLHHSWTWLRLLRIGLRPFLIGSEYGHHFFHHPL
jgi:hypothetical protein